MARYIDADAMREDWLQNGENECVYDTNAVLDSIDAQPTADVALVIHARWIKDGDVVVCSNCGEEHGWDEYRATYCEDCGAKMDLEV